LFFLSLFQIKMKKGLINDRSNPGKMCWM